MLRSWWLLYSFFDSSKVSLEDYNNYKNRFNGDWDLRKETLYYCSKDVVSLYQILAKFSILIFLKFKLNITGCGTLPSLAYKIYRTRYINKDHVTYKTVNKKGVEVEKSKFISRINDITIKEFTELKQA